VDLGNDANVSPFVGRVGSEVTLSELARELFSSRVNVLEAFSAWELPEVAKGSLRLLPTSGFPLGQIGADDRLGSAPAVVIAPAVFSVAPIAFDGML